MAAGGGTGPGLALEALLEMGFGARRALVAHDDDPDSDPELSPGLGAPPLGLGGPRQAPVPKDETQK